MAKILTQPEDNLNSVLPEIDEQAVENGEVFTRRWIVELMLDLVDYQPDRDLTDLKLVEPACGVGAFLGPIVRRLSSSLKTSGKDLTNAGSSVRAYDLVPRNVDAARNTVAKVLIEDGWPSSDAEAIAKKWIQVADYLLLPHQPHEIDIVIGNPPYIRLEDIPNARSNLYRKTWPTMGGRADIYVGFFEAGLRTLRPSGTLAFICADRWQRNQYGTRLRELVSSEFSMDLTLSAHDVDAFEEQVSAYPAITLISNKPQGRATVANASGEFGEAQAHRFARWFKTGRSPLSDRGLEAARLPHWFNGRDSWPAGSPERLAVLEYLNDNFQPLEDNDTGTKVGIGVATGADGIFVKPSSIDIEDSRLLPLSMGRDTNSGEFVWSGHYLVNPWGPDGKLIDLNEFPKTAAYFESFAAKLTKRHIAAARPARWFATIDRVDPSLTDKPKLLFPDMRMTSEPVLEPGGYYPHHNLYHVTSEKWDLEVLGGILLSKVAELFIDCYAVKMRGGTLRFQSQYLRRIRVPVISSINASDKKALATAFRNRDTKQATEIALRLYGLKEIPS